MKTFALVVHRELVNVLQSHLVFISFCFWHLPNNKSTMKTLDLPCKGIN